MIDKTVASLLHLGGDSLLVTVTSPYLEQHEVIDMILFIIAGMRIRALHLSDLPGIFLSLDGVHPQQHLLHAGKAGNKFYYTKVHKL